MLRFARWASAGVLIVIVVAAVASTRVRYFYSTSRWTVGLGGACLEVERHLYGQGPRGAFYEVGHWRPTWGRGWGASRVSGVGVVRTNERYPLWPAVLIAALTAGVMRLIPIRPRRGYCGRCGYNLTGNKSGICPECGTPIVKHAPRRRNGMRTWLILANGYLTAAVLVTGCLCPLTAPFEIMRTVVLAGFFWLFIVMPLAVATAKAIARQVQRGKNARRSR